MNVIKVSLKFRQIACDKCLIYVCILESKTQSLVVKNDSPNTTAPKSASNEPASPNDKPPCSDYSKLVSKISEDKDLSNLLMSLF